MAGGLSAGVIQLFKLPFHVDSPLAVGLITLAIALGFSALLWSYDRATSVGRALHWFFERRFGAGDRDKARRLGRVFLILMICAFAAIAAFGISVASGLIQNGDPPKLLNMDEFLQQHRR
jgi:hypothetical protein